jgi:DNA-binding NarL/FixJ family response regulator
MLTTNELKKLEIGLFEKGIPEKVRREIRKAKICIIDNQIDDLKSLHDSLKKEGFNNLDKHKKSPPIHEILNSHYDVIILDLNDVASEISADDGLGVLKLLKEREPALPILVVTGQKIPPEARELINLADLVRKKPVFASDLANDVDTLLKIYHDKFWASLFILKELNNIDIELKREIGFWKRFKLHRTRKAIEKRLISKDEDIIVKLEKILRILKNIRSSSKIINKILTNFIPDA